MKRKVSFRAPSYGSNLFHPFHSLSLSLSSLPLTALFYSINLLLLLSPFLLSSILSVQLETTCELREEDYEAAIENRENLFSNHRRNIILIIIIVITLNFEKGKKEIPFLPISPLSRSISLSTSENISRNRFEGNVICIRVCTKLWKSFVPTKPSLGSVCS